MNRRRGAVNFGEDGGRFLEEEVILVNAMLFAQERAEPVVDFDELPDGAAKQGEVIRRTRAREAGEHASGVATDAVVAVAIEGAHVDGNR